MHPDFQQSGEGYRKIKARKEKVLETQAGIFSGIVHSKIMANNDQVYKLN